MTLFTYTEQELLPKLRAQCEEIEESESINEFIASSKRVRKGLIQLKSKTEKLLESIVKSIELFNASETILLPTTETLKARIAVECEKLKRAVEREDVSYTMSKINYSIGMKDNEKHLVEALIESTSNFLKSNELEVLEGLLKEFNNRYNVTTNKTSNEFVYGIYHPQPNCTMLSKYDIQSKTLHTSLTLPQYSSLLQLQYRVFVSGGYKLCVNVVSEYIEDINKLVKRQAMNYTKCYHTVQAITYRTFVTVGGWNGSEISCCENIHSLMIRGQYYLHLIS